MNTISSSQNATFKEVKALKLKKHREDRGLFCIEGTRFVEEALKEEQKIQKIFLSDTFLSAGGSLLPKIMQSRAEIYQLPDKLFGELADTENPQGVLAVVKMQEYDLEQVTEGNSFILVLDSVQDPGNLGTMIRTADAAGATGIILSKGCVDLYNPKVLRSTMGSVFHLPIVWGRDILEVIRFLKEKGIRVLASDLQGASCYFDVPMAGKLAIIVGNEANGICPEVGEAADARVKIPMEGRAESLNASVAASLLLYEAVRQRRQK